MNKITVQCCYCGKTFEKELKCYNKAVKAKQNHCCSRKCSASHGNIENPRCGNPNISKSSDNKKDIYSPFRWFMLSVRARANATKRGRKNNEIDAKYLSEVWNSQNGICPYTGWKLLLPKNSSGWDDDQNKIGNRTKKASLDRIDNSLGYIKGNVRFISIMANLARNVYKEIELVTFCYSVTNNKCRVGSVATAADL